MSSPFDLSAEIFTQQYAAVAGEEPTNGDTYATACDVLKAWRNCNISTSEAKSKVRELVSDASAWNDTDWNDFWDFDCAHIPNNRTRDAEVSDWGEWSDCAPNVLGQGKQNRQRTIVKRKRKNCTDSLIQGVTLNEFRDCELSDDSENGNGNGSGNGSQNGNGNGNGSQNGSGDDGSGSGSGDDGNGSGSGSGSGDDGSESGDDGSGSGDDGSGSGDDGSGSGDGTNITIMGDTDDSESSLGDTLKDNWVLVGVALVGLALLR